MKFTTIIINYFIYLTDIKNRELRQLFVDEKGGDFMKDSRNADIETALGAGTTTAVLVETGIIGSSGLVSGAVAELGAATGMTVFANMGSGVAALLGAVGPVGWAIAGIGGAALLIHGIYRMT